VIRCLKIEGTISNMYSSYVDNKSTDSLRIIMKTHILMKQDSQSLEYYKTPSTLTKDRNTIREAAKKIHKNATSHKMDIKCIWSYALATISTTRAARRLYAKSFTHTGINSLKQNMRWYAEAREWTVNGNVLTHSSTNRTNRSSSGKTINNITSK
ncbi:hypothetical protein L9F63_003342, partial [Diploptera punctata]